MADFLSENSSPGTGTRAARRCERFPLGEQVEDLGEHLATLLTPELADRHNFECFAIN